MDEATTQAQPELVMHMAATSQLDEDSNAGSLATDANTTRAPRLKSPAFLHDHEIRDAVRVVNLVASGRNPFSDVPFENLSKSHSDAVIQAVCVIVSTLVEAEQSPAPAPGLKSQGHEPTGASSKRPLDVYLDGVEREAILEALSETHHNVTAAAKVLGVTYRALRYRMMRLGLE